MLEFNQEVIYTGQEEKTSKKGNKYLVIHMLDSQGKAFSCMAFEGVKVPINVEQLDRVDVTFRLAHGRYMQLNVLAITK